MTTRYIFIKDAATYLGTSVKGLRKRIEHRTIPFIKDGKRIVFDTLVLDKYMASRTVERKPWV